MASLSPETVYRGFWIDHSSGPILGATITAGGNTGVFIVALLSLLVSFAGSNLWDLIAFASYLLLSTGDPRSSDYHQHQLLLRNANSPSAYALESLKVMWCWRKKKPASWPQLLLSLLAAPSIFAGVLIAGLFASQVVDTSDILVLADSAKCAYPASLYSIADYANNRHAIIAQMDAITNTNSFYAQQCYGSNADSTLAQCRNYPKPSLPVSIRHEACPFGNLCFGTNGTALVQESALIDSHDDLGINSDPSNRVQWQHKLTCAPIDGSQYLTTINAMDEVPIVSDQYAPPFPGQINYHYSMGQSTSCGGYSNLTWNFNNYTMNTTNRYTTTIELHDTEQPSQDLSTWNASIAGLNKSDSSMYLISIASNSVANIYPNDDPVFSAHIERTYYTSPPKRLAYMADNPAGIIACQVQQRFCVGQTNCIPYQSYISSFDSARSIANPIQNATIQWLYSAAQELYIWKQLVAEATLSEGSQQAQLPNNQWEIEVKTMWPILGSAAQSTIPLIAFGASTLPDTAHPDLAYPMSTPEEMKLCTSVKMRAPQGVANINVLGLGLVVSLCSLIILANLTITPSLKLISRRTPSHGTGMIKIHRWIQDGLFQVLRKAFEGVGQDGWEDISCDIPLTKNGLQTMESLAKYPHLHDYPLPSFKEHRRGLHNSKDESSFGQDSLLSIPESGREPRASSAPFHPNSTPAPLKGPRDTFQCFNSADTVEKCPSETVIQSSPSLTPSQQLKTATTRLAPATVIHPCSPQESNYSPSLLSDSISDTRSH